MRFALMLALVLSQGPSPSGAEVRQPPQQQPPSYQKPATVVTSDAKKLPVIAVPRAPEAQGNTDQTQNERDDSATSDRWLIIFTGGLVVVGFLQFLLILGQRKDAQAVQRAFVFLDHVEYHRQRDSMGAVVGWQFHPVWRNSGTTPAVEAVSHANLLWLPNPLPDWFSFPDTPNENDSFFIAPGAATASGPLPADASSVMGSVSRKSHLYLYGWVEYKDSFKRAHLTRFAWEVTGATGDPIKGDYGFLFTNCRWNNCADEQCRRQSKQRPPKPPDAPPLFVELRNPPP